VTGVLTIEEVYRDSLSICTYIWYYIVCICSFWKNW